jgi:hypothetical protein
MTHLIHIVAAVVRLEAALQVLHHYGAALPISNPVTAYGDKRLVPSRDMHTQALPELRGTRPQ